MSKLYTYLNFDKSKRLLPAYDYLDEKIYRALAKQAVKDRLGDTQFTCLGYGAQSVALCPVDQSSRCLKLSYHTDNGDCTDWNYNAGKRWFDAPLRYKRVYQWDSHTSLIVYEQPLLIPMHKTKKFTEHFFCLFNEELQKYLIDIDGHSLQWGWSPVHNRWFLMDYNAYVHKRSKTVNRYIVNRLMTRKPEHYI